MGHGQTVRQHRGNANRGETYPPAVHADARHCAEPAATAPATRYPLSRFCPPPSVSDQRCCEDRRRQRCGPWCDPTLAGGLRRGTAQSSGAPLRRFRPLRSQVPRGPASHPTAAAPGTRQRSADCPPRPALIQIVVPHAGPGGPSKRADTLPIWSMPGPLGASATHRAPPHTGRAFSTGGARGLMPGGRGSQPPRHPNVIRLFHPNVIRLFSSVRLVERWV